MAMQLTLYTPDDTHPPTTANVTKPVVQGRARLKIPHQFSFFHPLGSCQGGRFEQIMSASKVVLKEDRLVALPVT